MPRPDVTAGRSPCCEATISCHEGGDFYCKGCYKLVNLSEVIIDENTPMAMSVAEEKLEAVARWDDLRFRIAAVGLTCEIDSGKILLRSIQTDLENVVSEFNTLDDFETQMAARGL